MKQANRLTMRGENENAYTAQFMSESIGSPLAEADTPIFIANLVRMVVIAHTQHHTEALASCDM